MATSQQDRVNSSFLPTLTDELVSPLFLQITQRNLPKVIERSWHCSDPVSSPDPSRKERPKEALSRQAQICVISPSEAQRNLFRVSLDHGKRKTWSCPKEAKSLPRCFDGVISQGYGLPLHIEGLHWLKRFWRQPPAQEACVDELSSLGGSPRPLRFPLSWLERRAMAGSGQLAFLVTISFQSLIPSVLSQDQVENSTVEPTSFSPQYHLSGSELAATIAVPSIFFGLLLIGLLVFMGLKVREKRQTEGTYRPSSEEQVGARVATNANLKLPPEERLI